MHWYSEESSAIDTAAQAAPEIASHWIFRTNKSRSVQLVPSIECYKTITMSVSIRAFTIAGEKKAAMQRDYRMRCRTKPCKNRVMWIVTCDRQWHRWTHPHSGVYWLALRLPYRLVVSCGSFWKLESRCKCRKCMRNAMKLDTVEWMAHVDVYRHIATAL